MTTLRLGSLFTGIEGLDLAVHAAFGATTVWHCEAPPTVRPRTSKERRASALREYLVERLGTRHPQVPLVSGVESVADGAPCEVDILAGGFPCIDLSQAGKREGLGGRHSGLWWDMAAAIRSLEPRVVVIENVRGLVNGGIHDVVGALADLGYDAEWCVLGACCLGAPHIRERVFILAWKGEPPCFAGGVLPNPGWSDGSWWTDPTTSDFPGRKERLAALGNACSPQQAHYALGVLSQRSARPVLPSISRVDGEWSDLWGKWPCAGALRDGWLALRHDIHHQTKWCIRDAGKIHKAPLPTPMATPYGASGNARDVPSRRRASLDTMASTGTLPTPMSSDSAGARKYARGNPSLTGAVLGTLPTPTTQDSYNDGAPSQAGRNTPPLNALAGTLPTPTAGDANASGSRNLDGSGAHAGVSLTDALCRGGSDVGGRETPKLNPVFVERMMGFEDGWSSSTPSKEK